DRVQQAYELIANGKAVYQTDNALEALQDAYAREETDEFVKATRIGDAVPIEDGDSIVFMNFRADRARELTQCFIDTEFTGFPILAAPKLSKFVTLTEY
ncbi:MAG TPA: 2,3-bisphosphoglycerate-independent phosphoglycerate mutase, partial [Methylophaga sp.]|nr:2,3-bisphosphoglycerate-independent phosphoglycerate mutase [Methylophaga sp.]